MTPLERAGWCWFRLNDERARFRQRLTLLERGRSVSDHAEYLTEVVGLLDIYLTDLSRLLAHQTRDHPFQSVLRPVLPAPVADAFCAVIGDLTRFPTKRHLIAYLGLAPNRARRPTLNRIYYTHASCLVRRRNATHTRWMQAYQRARGRGLHYMASLRCAWRALFLEAWKKSRPLASASERHKQRKETRPKPRASDARDRVRRDDASASETDDGGTCHSPSHGTLTTGYSAQNPRSAHRATYRIATSDARYSF